MSLALQYKKRRGKEYLQSDYICYLLYVGSLCYHVLLYYGPADVGVRVGPVRFLYVDVCIMISLA